MNSLPAVPFRRYLLFVALAATGCAIDLVTKSLAFERLAWGQVSWLWPDHAGFQIALNEGALFGLGQGGVKWFALLSTVAVIAIPIWLFYYRVANDRWVTIALGGITGGILGNLYDRLGMHGVIWPEPHPQAGQTAYAVRDWILWQYNNHWQWPNFNIADALLMTGAAVIFLRVLRAEQPSPPATETAAPPSPVQAR